MKSALMLPLRVIPSTIAPRATADHLATARILQQIEKNEPCIESADGSGKNTSANSGLTAPGGDKICHPYYKQTAPKNAVEV